MENINIYIVEKTPIARESLKYFVENTLKYKVIGEANSGKQCLEDDNIYKANVILMDYEMPLNGALVAAKSIKYENPKIKIIGMTIYTEKPYLKDLLFAGFSGCVFKQKIFETLGNTINMVINNKLEFPDCMLED